MTSIGLLIKINPELKHKNKFIKLTRHAKIKISQRNISLEDIYEVVSKPKITEKDRFDNSLVHLIGMRNKKCLRIIGRWEREKDFLVISAFYDRRLKEEKLT